MAAYRNKGKKSLRQPDEFITFSSRLLSLVIVHKTKMLAGLILLVVAGLAWSGVGYLSRRSDARSLLLLSQASVKYEAAKAEKGAVGAFATAREEFARVTESYGKQSGGEMASFLLADAAFAAGEYDQAATLYRKAAADFSKKIPLEALATIGLGYSLEQKGDNEGALQVFSGMDTGAGSLLGDEVLYALGRLYGALGKADKKAEMFKKLAENGGNIPGSLLD